MFLHFFFLLLLYHKIQKYCKNNQGLLKNPHNQGLLKNNNCIAISYILLLFIVFSIIYWKEEVKPKKSKKRVDDGSL